MRAPHSRLPSHTVSPVIFLLVFASTAMIVSLWSGIFWRNSAFILIVSAILSVLACRRFRLGLNVPLPVIFLGLLSFSMATYDLLLIHPFFNSSADPAPTIGSLVVRDRIPETYEPYSSLPYNYQIGFPLFARIFIDLSLFPPYIITWLIAAIFVPVQLALVYSIASRIGKSREAGYLAAIAFLGTKVVFQNIYVGEYSWILATAFILASVFAYLEKSRFVYLFVPAVFILNPAIALNFMILAITWLAFYRKSKTAFHISLSLILAVPAFLINYIPVASNNISIASESSPSISALLPMVSAFPLWTGLVPFSLFAVSIAALSAKKIRATKVHKFLISLFLVSAILFSIFGSGINTLIAARIVEISGIAAVFLSACVLSSAKAGRSKYSMAAILLICLIVFFSSSQLNHLRSGSKISYENAQFAEKFRQFDPSLQKTLFLMDGAAKAAEFSNKIPYVVNRTSHFISASEYVAVRGPALAELEKREAEAENIVKTKCIECIYKLDIAYAVVDPIYAGMKLRQEDVAFSYGGIDVYRVK